ncbi:TPA: tetratricopeptide repeat protein, partial [Escherichia coli]
SKYANGKAFLSYDLPGYFIDYIPLAGATKLVFTFENADQPSQPRPDGFREPWGGMWLHNRGYAVIGVKPKLVEWYRGRDLHEFFRSEELQSLVSQFEQVFLYGSSMGGFAAMAFADAIPGATVIAFNPQSTLDPSLVPWDTRYEEGRKQDWTGDFADARIGASKAKSVFVAYDPLFKPDRKHIERLDQSNLIAFKMPLMGHIIAHYMNEVGILSAFVEGALAGTLSSHECNRLARERRKTPRYYYCLGTRSGSVMVKETCLLKLAKFQKLSPIYQKNLMSLISSTGSWHLIQEPELQKALIEFDDENLFELLKQASDHGHPRQALEVSQLAISRRKVSPAMLILIAECLWKLGRLQEAEAYARLAVHCAPVGYGNAYRILARILFSDKRATEARDVAQSGVEVERASFLGWCDLARYSEAIGEFTDALMAFKQAAKLQPGNPHLKADIERLNIKLSPDLVANT